MHQILNLKETAAKTFRDVSGFPVTLFQCAVNCKEQYSAGKKDWQDFALFILYLVHLRRIPLLSE